MAYELLSCPFCDFTSKQETRFVAHLIDVHQKNDDDQQKIYDEKRHNGTRPQCKCGCGEPLRWDGWKKGYTALTFGTGYVRGHNARVESSFSNPDVIEKMKEKRAEGLASGRNKVWNSGLTKETDERVAKGAKNISQSLQEGYESGRIVDWHHLDKEKAKKAFEKQSEKMKQRYETGEIVPWNKGKTRQNDETLMRISELISHTMLTKPGAAVKRFTPEELVSLVEKHGSGFKLVSDPTTYQNKYQRLQFQCLKCNQINEKNLMMLVATPVCFFCHPKESKGQLELYDFVKSISPDATSSSRDVISPKELDVWVPSQNFALEYNGLFYHSEFFINDVNYHANKTNSCQQKGIRLFHVFSDEWEHRRPVIESMIRCRLGKNPHRLMARKLQVRPLDSKLRQSFFERNHLDGDVLSKVAWGLFDGEELVSALSLRSPFHVAEGKIELARFANRLDTTVAGALGRLLKIARAWAKENGFNELMTYVDTRYGDGHGYERVGFQLVKQTPNRFWWTDGHQRYDRFKYRADKSRGMTERQVAEEAGVFRIYGCPNKLYKMSL